MEFAAFGWAKDVPDPEAVSTFEDSCINWHDLDKPESAAMLHWYRQLLQLRREYTALTSGNRSHVDVAFDEASRWLIMTREKIQIICNFSLQTQIFPAQADAVLLLRSDAEAHLDGTAIHIPAMAAAILQLG
jgi:maltooligosyltrehalose trehalohydrolase